MTSRNLVFRAGPGAFESIRRHGFAIERIGTIAGASGGAKWLVLSQIDRAILTNIVPKLRGPVHLIGSSIGSWRLACYAQSDPLAAITRFEDAYIGQSFSRKPGIDEITDKSREIVRILLADDAASEILAHRVFRTHIMTARARHLAASEHRFSLAASLIAAASLNVISRRTLALFYERALFFDARELPPWFSVKEFSMQKIQLHADNLEDVIVATGSIPLVLHGVRNIAGASHGVYRDGGIIDYHLDLPHSEADRLTLYPHFFDRIIPGW
ncbi:MAG: patatin-like phospholipase family protein, partial [Proteobacteria bacterium]|nr:patatin-like phospholipase family protein [Pseudomonadota bacterium]